MTSTIHTTPKSTGKQSQSLFFNDLSTPVTNRRTETPKFTTPAQSAAVSALWRANSTNSDLPPPPMFTLEDRSDLSPESFTQDYPIRSPEHNSNPRTPVRTPFNDLFTTSGNKSPKSGKSNSNPMKTVNSSWWSGEGNGDTGKGSGSGPGSPVDGVVHREPAVLLTLPPPREVARPEVRRNCLLPVGEIDEEEWVTVYGYFVKLIPVHPAMLFSLADTDLVLREFEKCGVILKHISGPRNSNWMHILYKSRFDAQTALSKNGSPLNGALIIGVKLVDPILRQSLNDRLHNQGFMPMPPPTTTRKTDPVAFNPSTRSYNLNGPTNAAQSGTNIAAPAKSMASKVMNLMFGL